jgi:hypothetical protein
MNPRYLFMISQYTRLDTVNGTVLVIAIWLPLMCFLLDKIVKRNRATVLNIWTIFSFLVYLALMLYTGILNHGG